MDNPFNSTGKETNMAKKRLTKMEAFVEGFQEEVFWVGIDVHRKSYHMALQRADGQTHTWVTSPAPSSVISQLRHLGVSIEGVAYEAGPTGYGLARELKKEGFPVIVAAPNKIPRPPTREAKNDRIDCIKLAFFASKGLLHPVTVPTRTQEAHRCLCRRRGQKVRMVRTAKQQIKSFLLNFGIEYPDGSKAWSKKAIKALHDLELPFEERLCLDDLLEDLEFAQKKLAKIEKNLEKITSGPQHQAAMRNLRSVPGVGPVVATTFRLELFDPKRFCNGEQVARYCELAPIVHQSGSQKARSRISKKRRNALRSQVIQATWQWIGRDPGAKAKYRKLLAKTGLAQKAVVAMARKLVILLWRLSVEERPYRFIAANGVRAGDMTKAAEEEKALVS